MNLSALFDQARALPVLPRVLRELLTGFDDSVSGMGELSRLISSDPVICMRLLKLANSARYRPAQGVNSAYQAVQLLGLVNVRSLVISVGLMGCFNHIPSNLLESFWRQSLRTAALARHWSAHSAVDGELAYILGLLRCIGQLLMRQGLAERMLAMDGEVDPAAPTRMVSERAALGFSYAEVGAELARRWLLPSLFSEVISATDALPVDSNAATLAALIQIAAWQAWVSEQQLGDEQVDAMWPSELAQRAGVPSQQGGSHFDDWDDLCDNLQDLLTQ